MKCVTRWTFVESRLLAQLHAGCRTLVIWGIASNLGDCGVCTTFKHMCRSDIQGNSHPALCLCQPGSFVKYLVSTACLLSTYHVMELVCRVITQAHKTQPTPQTDGSVTEHVASSRSYVSFTCRYHWVLWYSWMTLYLLNRRLKSKVYQLAWQHVALNFSQFLICIGSAC